MSDITSVDLEADQDLRDVFKLMYDDEEDWTIDEVCPNFTSWSSTNSRMIIHHWILSFRTFDST